MTDSLTGLSGVLTAQYTTYKVVTGLGKSFEQFLKSNSTLKKAIYISWMGTDPQEYLENSAFTTDIIERYEIYVKTNETNPLTAINGIVLFLNGYLLTDTTLGTRIVRITNWVPILDELDNYFLINLEVV
jgi:hypothetical protein